MCLSDTVTHMIRSKRERILHRRDKRGWANVNATVRVAVGTKSLFMQQQQKCGNSQVAASTAAWSLTAKHSSGF